MTQCFVNIQCNMPSSIRIAGVEHIGHRFQGHEGISDILLYAVDLSDPHVKSRRSLPKKVHVMTVNTDRAIQNTFDADVDDPPNPGRTGRREGRLAQCRRC